MNTTHHGPEMAQHAQFLRTDVSPEEIFQAIGRLRKEARDEIDRLLRFLDKTDDFVSREVEDDDSDLEETADLEPSLCGVDADPRRHHGCREWCVDKELDASEDEPSLGSPISSIEFQPNWSAGSSSDREDDGADQEGNRQNPTLCSMEGAFAGVAS